MDGDGGSELGLVGKKVPRFGKFLKLGLGLGLPDTHERMNFFSHFCLNPDSLLGTMCIAFDGRWCVRLDDAVF